MHASVCMCVCAYAAIGCLSRQSVDALHSPYLTTVCDGSADPCQLNANVRRQNAAGASELHVTSPAVNVSRSSPLSEDTHSRVSAAGQAQLCPPSFPVENESVEEQCQLTQYPLADLSSVLAEQTLVSVQTSRADAAQLTQYPLSDNSSDASVHGAEMVSPAQFPLAASPNDVIAALHHDADDATMVDRSGTGSCVELQESGMQCHCEPVQQLSEDQSSLSVSAGDVNAADQHSSMTFTTADGGVNSCNNQLADDQGKYNGVDLLVFVSINKRSSVSRSLSPAYSADFNRAVDPSDKMLKSDGRCLASGNSPSILTDMKTEYVNKIDKTGLSSAILTTDNPRLDRDESVIVTDSKTVPAEAKVLESVEDLLSVSSSAVAGSLPTAGYVVQQSDNKLPDSGWPLSSSAFVEQAGSAQLDACKTSDLSAVFADSGRDQNVPLDHNAVASDSAVSKFAGMQTDDKEQTGNQAELLPSERSSTDDAESLRNAADGSEASDILSSAVKMSTNVSHITAAQSIGSVSHTARCVIVTGSDDSSIITEKSGAVTQGHCMSDHHQPCDSVIIDTNRDEIELSVNVESHPQHLTVVSQDSSEVVDTDHLALPLEQDSGSEFDEDDHLGDNVKMILAKYRIRRGPIGSDSTPVATSAKIDSVLLLDADDSLLLSGQHTESNTAKDIDTCSCSDSSDDTLAVRVKALLIREQQQSSSKTLPTTASSELSQGTGKVPSVCSSESTSVDYSSLSRELNEIQMNLDSMRNSESSCLGSQQSSTSSSCIHSPVTDMSVTQEPHGLVVQQKTCLDQLLQHRLVGHDGDSLHVDYSGFVSKAGAGILDFRRVEADTLGSVSGHQSEMSLISVLSIGGNTKPLATLRAELDSGHCQDSTALVNKDLLRTGTDVQTVQRPVQPLMTLSNSSAFSLMSASGTKFADSYTSGQSLHKSSESLLSRSELMSTADEDVMSSTGSLNLERFYAHKLGDGQNVNVSDSDRNVQDSSAVHDTVSKASSLQTDMRQSESTSYTHLDDFRSTHDQSTTAEAAVKKLEQSLSSLIRTCRNNTSSASNVYSNLHEVELLKQSSVDAALANHQLPALSDDDCHLSETELSHSCSDSCGLSPVPKESPINVLRSVHPLLAVQLDGAAAAAQFDRSIELRSPTACNDSLSSQSFDKNVQQTESSTPRRMKREKLNEYQVRNQLMSYSDTDRLLHVLQSCSFGFSNQTVTTDAQFMSMAHLQFTPLAELPHGCGSSESDSYDGDNEQLLTDQQSYDGVSELRSFSADDGPRLSADRTPVNYGVDVSVLCLDAARSTQTAVSESPPNLNLLQPYQ